MELDFSSQPPVSSVNNHPSPTPVPPVASESGSTVPLTPSASAVSSTPSAPQPQTTSSSIPISTTTNGDSLSQLTPSAPSTSGRMDEIMSEQVTTKNMDAPAGPAMPARQPDKPKGSKLRLILAIMFVALLLGGGAYVALATDFGKELLGLKSADKALVIPENSLTDTGGIIDETETGIATPASEEVGTGATTSLADETASTAGSATSTIAQSDATRKSHLVQIQTAVEAYKTQTGKYPISAVYSKATNSTSEIYSLLVPDFLDSMPQDPKSADGWWYGYKSVDGENYAVTARLEDTTDTQGVMDGEVFLYILTNSN